MSPDQVDQGQFINLKAFTECRTLRLEGARLPDWRTIRASYPEFIHRAPEPTRHRLFITHRWDANDHPDPTGWQMKALRQLGEHYNYQSPEFCFWYDYMSLPQKPREGMEKKIFARGLDNLRRTVAECENVALISRTGEDSTQDLSAMRKRGWIIFELFIARNNIKLPLPLYERHEHRIQFGRDEQSSWDAVIKDVATLVPFDSPEILLTWFERRGIRCTNGSDLRRLCKLLHRELVSPSAGPPPFEIKFGVEMRLTQQQLNTLKILEVSRQSIAYPHIFLKDIRREGGHRLDLPLVWIATFLRRPPIPPLDTWINCGSSELQARLIDVETSRSPMYPGIIFEIGDGGQRFRATLDTGLSSE